MKLDMAKVNYRIEGEGVPVFLIGGQFMAIAAWEAIISDLGRFYKIITLEYPNQGISETDFTVDNLKAYAEYTLDFMKDRGLDPAETLVFGLSFGATVVKSMTFDFGARFKAVILAAIGPNSLQSYVTEIYGIWIRLIEGGDLEMASRVIFSKLLSPEFISANPGILDFAASDLAGRYKDKPGSMLALLNSTKNYLVETSGRPDQKFACETHLIGAESDPMIPAICVEKYARILSSPYHELPGGHIITLEQPVELLRILHEIIGKYDVA